MNLSRAIDPRSWLFLYNASDADSLTWAEHYRDSRGIPYANMLGLRNIAADETTDAATWLAISDVVRSHIARNRMSQIKGILLGHNLPGVVTISDNRYATTSLLAHLRSTSLNAANPLYLPSSVTISDLPPRASLTESARYLVSEITAPTLAAALSITAHAEALSSIAADGALVSNLLASRDTVHAPATANSWPALDAWRTSIDRERIALPADDASNPLGQSICLTTQTAGTFSELNQLRSLFVCAADDAAAAARDAASPLGRALLAGYAFVLAPVDSASPASCPNPAALFAALRAGATFAEATALALPHIAGAWRCIGDPLWGMPTPRAGHAVYRSDDASLLGVAPDTASPQLDIAGRLPAGEWSLHIRTADRFGCLSAPLQRDVWCDNAGSAIPAMRPVNAAHAVALSAGYVQLHWSIDPPRFGRSLPDHFEIALSDEPHNIIATLDADSRTSVYSTTVGPFAHSRCIALRVRAARGAGSAQDAPSPWVAARAVIARAAAPEAPKIVA